MKSWEPRSTKTGGKHLFFLPGYPIGTGLPKNSGRWVAHEFLLAPGLGSSTWCSSAELPLQPSGSHQGCWGHQGGCSCSPLPCPTPPMRGDSHSFITLKTCLYWKISSGSSPLSGFPVSRLLRITLNQVLLVHPPNQLFCQDIFVSTHGCLLKTQTVGIERCFYSAPALPGATRIMNKPLGVTRTNKPSCYTKLHAPGRAKPLCPT